MNNYDKNKESSYLQYWYVNNLYRWTMSQKLLVNNFKWVKDISKFDEGFIKSYNEESDGEYFLEVAVQYPENLHNLFNDLPFCLKKLKLKNQINWISIEKVHRIIRFNQKALLKSYIDMNTDLRKKAKNDFQKYIFKLRNNSVFGKTMENVRKQGDMKLVTTEKRRNYLVSEPNCNITKSFFWKFVKSQNEKDTGTY